MAVTLIKLKSRLAAVILTINEENLTNWSAFLPLLARMGNGPMINYLIAVLVFLYPEKDSAILIYFYVVATCDGRQILQMNDDQRVKISLSRKESSVYSGRYISGTSVVFSCSDPRFQLRGATSSVCNDSGSWGNFIKPSCGKFSSK